jgi:hypothetical protein
MLGLTVCLHYTDDMITQYKNEDAFNASEDLLLVPLPIHARAEFQGFAGQVMRRFPIAEIALRETEGLGEGETLVVGYEGGYARWAQPYSLALCGLHRRAQYGWQYTPQYLQMALDRLQASRDKRLTIATAGIPGTGYSGLLGGAEPSDIKAILEAHPVLVTVYQDNTAGDRAALLEVDSPLDGTQALGV